MMGVIAVLSIIGVLIFLVSGVAQNGIDTRLTREGKQRANRTNQLVYYDQIAKCYRSTKTNQKAARFISRDINGEPYEYVVTVPTFAATTTLGKFIEARYLNVNKWDDPVAFDDYHRLLFFGGK